MVCHGRPKCVPLVHVFALVLHSHFPTSLSVAITWYCHVSPIWPAMWEMAEAVVEHMGSGIGRGMG